MTNTPNSRRPYPPVQNAGLFAGLEQAFTPRRAISYIRVSRPDQAKRGGREEGFSIPAQREANKKKAQSLGAVIVKEFVDPGETGTNMKREGLQKMLKYLAEDPDIDYVIVHKLDRLARDRELDAQLTRVIRSHDTQLVSTMEAIDDTPSGMLMHGILASIAEFYSRNLATEVMKGLIQKAETGGTPGRAPLGYLNKRYLDDMGREYRTVETDPVRAPLMKSAFELYATGEWSLRNLADHLEAQGLTTRATPERPSKPISDKVLLRLFRNPYYRGVVLYQDIEYAGTHELLIDPSTWFKVQAVLDGHRNGERTRVHAHYLKSTVRCGRCGSRMIVHNAKGRNGDIYPYFICIAKRQKTTNCSIRAILIDTVEDKVEALYKTISLSTSDRQRIENAILEQITATSRDSIEHRKNLKLKKDQLERERQRLLQAHYADAIPLELLKTEQDRIAKTLATIETDLASLTDQDTTARANLAGLLELLESCHQTYKAVPGHLRRLLNLAIFEEILIDIDDDQDLRLTAKLSKPLDTLTGQFRAIAQQTRPQTNTSPVPKDEARASSCSTYRSDPMHNVIVSHTVSMVEVRGFEPLTFCMPCRRATNCAIPPYSLVHPAVSACFPGRGNSSSVDHQPDEQQISRPFRRWLRLHRSRRRNAPEGPGRPRGSPARGVRARRRHALRRAGRARSHRRSPGGSTGRQRGLPDGGSCGRWRSAAPRSRRRWT